MPIAARNWSWQPSHDENLNTATRGRGAVAAAGDPAAGSTGGAGVMGGMDVMRRNLGRRSEAADAEEALDPVVAEHRAVEANKKRPELAQAALADGAAHVPLE